MSPSICRYYPNCKRGNSCHFLHLEKNASKRLPSTVSNTLLLSQQFSNITLSQIPSSSSTEPSSSKSVDCQCSICFEEAEKYGLLAECNHIYCLQCVKEWRSQTDIGKMKRTCPICRIESLFYIVVGKDDIVKLIQDSQTSSSLGSSTKKAMIDNRLLHRKSTPCKFINRKPPSSNRCPFGARCQFSHLDSTGNEILVRDTRHRNRKQNICLTDLHLIELLASHGSNGICPELQSFLSSYTGDGIGPELYHFLSLFFQ